MTEAEWLASNNAEAMIEFLFQRQREFADYVQRLGNRPGDLIELETIQGKDVYRVERTWVVNPEDVSVLDPTSTRSLTLVTCYPFYFVGSAPSRFIVRAVRIADGRRPAPASIEGG